MSSAGWPGRMRETPPLMHAAHVLGAVGHDDEAIVSGLRRGLGFDQLAGGRKGQHFVVADVDDNDVALRVERDAVRLPERRALLED